MGEEFWKLTQEELQGESDPLFSKPKLSEKLLQKPPFRFLHDIVTEIQKSTGFAQGLFRDEELDSKAVASDKESKAAYLSKIIQCVSHALGESVPAKPQKIMAGLEPENTNQFLRQLARAARQARGGDQGATAVRMVLGGEGAEPTPPPAEPARQPPEAPTEPAQAPPPSESKEDAAVTDGKHHSSARRSVCTRVAARLQRPHLGWGTMANLCPFSSLLADLAKRPILSPPPRPLPSLPPCAHKPQRSKERLPRGQQGSGQGA